MRITTDLSLQASGGFSSPRCMRGAALARTMGISLLLVVVGLIAFFEGRKAYLDHQVQEFCEKDGGIRVFEKIKLPSDKFQKMLNKFGSIHIPSRGEAKPSDEYYSEIDIHYYRRGNPEMSRSQFRIVRKLDGKTLGEVVIYGRGGGDFPSPSHDSSFSCPEPAKIPSLSSSIFVLAE